MGVHFASASTKTFIGPLPANATETVCYTTPPINLPVDFAAVLLLWFIMLTAGTSTTQLIFRIRRGVDITGAQVGAQDWITQQFTAGQKVLYSGSYVDLPGAVSNQQYSLNVVETGATVAGTVTEGSFLAYVL